MAVWLAVQENFVDALKSLIKLNFALMVAYQKAMNVLEDESYKDSLEKFKMDFERQITVLNNFLKKSGERISTGSRMKHVFPKMEIIFSNALGDKVILMSLENDEEDVCIMYENLITHPGKMDDLDFIFRSGLACSVRRKIWFQGKLNKFSLKYNGA